ncbi:MAG: hypothetical protein QM523_02495 [Candidatus Pacebacteria bacterium]|nr:hypothetical protein [Candidatus Paceibacterota bacterium]
MHGELGSGWLKLFILFGSVVGPLWVILAVAKVKSFYEPLCFLSGLDRQVFTQLRSVRYRVNMMVRGVAVIISPLAFTLALLFNGEAIVGQSPYLILLPILVFALDWLLVACSYDKHNPEYMKSKTPLVILRIFVLLLSVFMSLFAGLLTEQGNLLTQINEKEKLKLEQTDRWRKLSEVETNLASRNNALEAQLATIEELKRKRAEAQQFEIAESGGESRQIDGVAIVGGRCGPKCLDWRQRKEAADSRIKELESSSLDSEKLKAQMKEIQDQKDKMVDLSKKPPTLGTLAISFINKFSEGGAESAALILKIFFIFVVIMVIELFAFFVSEFPIPTIVIDGVKNRDILSREQMETGLQEELAQVANNKNIIRDSVGGELPPLLISVDGNSTVMPAQSGAAAVAPQNPQQLQ